jgi:hypothetical protein
MLFDRKTPGHSHPESHKSGFDLDSPQVSFVLLWRNRTVSFTIPVCANVR